MRNPYQVYQNTQEGHKIIWPHGAGAASPQSLQTETWCVPHMGPDPASYTVPVSQISKC